MADAEDRTLKKWKEKAIQWHEKRGPSVEDEDALLVELEFLLELKKAIVDSRLDRKSIFLSLLSSQEEKLRKGVISAKLPNIIKNMLKKPEMENTIMFLTKKYKIGGSSLYYLWGIGEEIGRT